MIRLSKNLELEPMSEPQKMKELLNIEYWKQNLLTGVSEDSNVGTDNLKK